jgi:hypothetical protein
LNITSLLLLYYFCYYNNGHYFVNVGSIFHYFLSLMLLNTAINCLQYLYILLLLHYYFILSYGHQELLLLLMFAIIVFHFFIIQWPMVTPLYINIFTIVPAWLFTNITYFGCLLHYFPCTYTATNVNVNATYKCKSVNNTMYHQSPFCIIIERYISLSSIQSHIFRSSIQSRSY